MGTQPILLLPTAERKKRYIPSGNIALDFSFLQLTVTLLELTDSSLVFSSFWAGLTLNGWFTASGRIVNSQKVGVDPKKKSVQRGARTSKALYWYK